MEDSGFGSPPSSTGISCNFKQKIDFKYILKWVDPFLPYEINFCGYHFEEVVFSQTLRFFDQFTENSQQESCVTLLSAKINPEKILV